MHRRADIIDDDVIIILHSAADPVEHHADKAVFIKFRNEGLVLLGNLHALALLIHHASDQTVGQLEQEVLHLVPADTAVGIENKGLVFQHRLKNLQQPLMPGIIGFLSLERPGCISTRS